MVLDRILMSALNAVVVVSEVLSHVRGEAFLLAALAVFVLVAVTSLLCRKCRHRDMSIRQSLRNDKALATHNCIHVRIVDA